jgi:dTDP-4-dehydrorhamnose 3,5-epimerase
VIFTPTALSGAVVVELDRREDERGFFARSFCRREFEAQGLDPCVAQCNVSFNRRRATLRGLHWQAAPHGEVKLVRVTRGALWDVIVDLRAGSPTFTRWFGVELTADNRRALYIPAGFAHGFQTLVEDVEVFYQMSAFYVPDAQRGARWDDPAFGIEWPLRPPFLSDRDASYPDFIPDLVS